MNGSCLQTDGLSHYYSKIIVSSLSPLNDRIHLFCCKLIRSLSCVHGLCDMSGYISDSRVVVYACHHIVVRSAMGCRPNLKDNHTCSAAESVWLVLNARFRLHHSSLQSCKLDSTYGLWDASLSLLVWIHLGLSVQGNWNGVKNPRRQNVASTKSATSRAVVADSHWEESLPFLWQYSGRTVRTNDAFVFSMAWMGAKRDWPPGIKFGSLMISFLPSIGSSSVLLIMVADDL